jgi:hypothetical protein
MSKRYGVRLLLLCALSLAASSAAFASDDKHGERKCDEDFVMCNGSCPGEDCQCEDEDCDDNDNGGNDKEFCEEFHGAAFGLCNAFCNAQQCHLFPKHSCDVLRQNFERQTGLSTFPCEGEGTPTVTPTDTPLPLTPTTTPPLTATGSATATATRAVTGTATDTATIATATATATDTAAAPSATATSEPFQTSTATATDTPEVPVATATSTQLATPTGTAAGVIASQCTCDCDGNGRVSIDDLLRSVLVVLGGLPQSDCEALADHGALRIQDLIRGVRNALDGCS